MISTQLTKELMIQLGVGSGSLGLGGTWDLKNHHLLLIVSSAYACDQDPPRDTLLPFQCGTWDEIALIRSQALLDCQSLRLIVGPPCCRLSKQHFASDYFKAYLFSNTLIYKVGESLFFFRSCRLSNFIVRMGLLLQVV